MASDGGSKPKSCAAASLGAEIEFFDVGETQRQTLDVAPQVKF